MTRQPRGGERKAFMSLDTVTLQHTNYSHQSPSGGSHAFSHKSKHAI